MNRPRFFKRNPMNNNGTPPEGEGVSSKPVEEAVVDEVVTDPTVEQHENESASNDNRSFTACEACEGTGLADKKERGQQASVLCTECEGSGRV